MCMPFPLATLHASAAAVRMTVWCCARDRSPPLSHKPPTRVLSVETPCVPQSCHSFILCARDAALLRRFVEPQVEKVTEVFNHRKCVDGDYAMVNQAVRAQQMQMPTGVPAGGSWLEQLLCMVCTCLLHL
jgi:hypothetical protein